jgi:hypothetical protein
MGKNHGGVQCENPVCPLSLQSGLLSLRKGGDKSNLQKSELKSCEWVESVLKVCGQTKNLTQEFIVNVLNKVT